jgi:oxaloacetate decarboxylase alpha subunit
MEQIGMRTVVSLIYSISPRHTDEYFVQKAGEAAAIRPYRICFKDVGGILTPERARVLIPKILAAAGEVPVEFHGHCCTGMGSTCILVAAECGIRSIHTGIPPLAEGNAQPSIFSSVRNLSELGYDCAIDLQSVRRASKKLYAIAHRHRYPIGAPLELDYRQYQHQTPGGMISHLAFQLEKIGQEAKLPEVLAETARVRADLGYPIMVTPLSQFVGSQAAIHIITGQRYESVTDEVIRYAQGYYGEEAIEVMDPDIRRRILDRKRAEELAKKNELPDVTLDELRTRYGNVTDEELTYIAGSCGLGALPLMRRKKEVTPYRFEVSPEARWLRDLPHHHGVPQTLEVQRDGVAIRVGLNGPQPS